MTARSVLTGLERSIRLAIVFVAALFFVWMGTVGGVDADPSTTEIDACTTITESGSYALSDDVAATEYHCIRVTADDVAIDGGGHTLELDEATRERFAMEGHPSRGNRMYGTGIETDGPVHNVTVTDLTVSDWDTGVLFDDVTGGSIDNVTASGNVDGIAIERSSETTVAGSVAANNYGEGIVLRSTAESAVVESDTERNARAGVALVDSTDNAVRDVTVGHNRGDGLALEGADRNDISGIVSSEDTTGVFLLDARENTLSDVTVDESRFLGVGLGYASDNEFAELTVSNNAGAESPAAESAAIWLYSASDNRFDGVTAVNNRAWMIYAANGSVDNPVDDLVIDGDDPTSIVVTDLAIDRDGTVSSVPPADEEIDVVPSDAGAEPTAGSSDAGDESAAPLARGLPS